MSTTMYNYSFQKQIPDVKKPNAWIKIHESHTLYEKQMLRAAMAKCVTGKESHLSPDIMANWICPGNHIYCFHKFF